MSTPDYKALADAYEAGYGDGYAEGLAEGPSVDHQTLLEQQTAQIEDLKRRNAQQATTIASQCAQWAAEVSALKQAQRTQPASSVVTRYQVVRREANGDWTVLPIEDWTARSYGQGEVTVRIRVH